LAESYTTFGKIGIKVWVYMGDHLPSETDTTSEKLAEKNRKVK